MSRKYSQQQVADLIRRQLEAFAARNGLPPQFVQAALAIVAQESGFHDDAVNDGKRTGTNEYSVGPWQINLKAHPTVTPEQAMDPEFATSHRLASLLSAWNKVKTDWMGGNAVQAQRRFHSLAQGSILPTATQAQDALNVAGSLAEGRAHQYQLPTGAYTGVTVPPGGPTSFFGSGQHLMAYGGGDDPLLKPPDGLDGLASLIEKQLIEAAGSGDENAAFRVQQLSSTLQGIRRLKTQNVTVGGQSFDVSPEQAAEFAMNLGIKALDIRHEMDMLTARQAFEANQKALDRAQELYLKTGDQNLAREQLALERFKITSSLGLDEKRFELEERKFGYEQEIGYKQLSLQERQVAMQERNANLSALVDLIGLQMEQGKLSTRAAERALDALVETYKMMPLAGGYFPGYEPGGAYQQALSRIGGQYSPENFRIKPFPIDLQALTKAGQDFDLSKAWQTAQQIISQGGYVPAPGGGSPSLQTSPVPGATIPPASAASGLPVASSGISPQVPSQPPGPSVSAPAVLPPTQSPPRPCPQGWQASFANGQWTCLPPQTTPTMPTAPASPLQAGSQAM